MERLFGRLVPVSSSKSFLGHTLGASGIIEMIATLVTAEEGQIPPTLNFAGPRPGCADLDYVPNAPRIHPVRRTGVAPLEIRAKMSGLLVARHFPGLVKAGDCASVMAVPA